MLSITASTTPDEGRLPASEQPGVADGAPQNATQHVAATLARREDTVRQEERHCARMVREDAVADAFLGVRVVWPADELGDTLEQRCEAVRVVVGVGTLEDGRDPLEPGPVSTQGAGSGWSSPLSSRSNCMNTRFHSSMIVPASFSSTKASVVADRSRGLPQVVVELGARAAGTRVGHLPEVVLVAEPEDAIRREPDLLPPEVGRLVVGVVHGGVEALGIEPVHLGHQLPRVPDGVALEVVAEREVPEHLEERMVPGRPSHFLEVVVLATGAHALLRGDRAPVARVVLAEEDALELHHPRVGEQEGGIVRRHQRGAGANGVPPIPEVLEESASDLGGLHGTPNDERRDPASRTRVEP
jgi:hypothetical protein